MPLNVPSLHRLGLLLGPQSYTWRTPCPFPTPPPASTPFLLVCLHPVLSGRASPSPSSAPASAMAQHWGPTLPAPGAHVPSPPSSAFCPHFLCLFSQLSLQTVKSSLRVYTRVYHVSMCLLAAFHEIFMNKTRKCRVYDSLLKIRSPNPHGLSVL